MKSPDEIKKGLECCSSFDSDMCLKCPYDDGHVACCLDKNQDALAYIAQLEQRLAQVGRERDAAIKDFTRYVRFGETECLFCKNKDKVCLKCEWQWRGVNCDDRGN